MYDVLVVGELNVDIILNRIDGFPEVGKEKLSKDLRVVLGSSSAIFASNLATLGAQVAFVGKIGKDQFGQLVETSLKQKGVGTQFLVHTNDHQTGATVVLNYDMDRAMVTYPGAMEQLTEKEVRNDILTEARHLHVSSVFLQPNLKKNLVQLMERAKSFGLTTSLDPQWDPAEQWDLNLEELLPVVDVFLPNRSELKHLTKTNSVHHGIDAIKDFANIVAVKDGENGAILYHEGETIRKPAYLNKEVADCIGAGDSFDAGFISQYIQGKDLQTCLDFANLVGAVNTTEAGGTAAFQDLNKVKSIAKERFSFSI